VILAFTERIASILVGSFFDCGAFFGSPAVGIRGRAGVGMVAPFAMGCVLIGPVGVGLLLCILNTASRSDRNVVEGDPFEPPVVTMTLLTEVSATIFTTEPCSRLTDEAVAGGIAVIVTIAVIVCI